MPYCRDCGGELPQDSRFCPACGRDQGAPAHQLERERISTPDADAPSQQQPSPGALVGRGVLTFFGGCCLLPVLLVLLLLGVPLLAGTAGIGAAGLADAVFEDPLFGIVFLGIATLFIALFVGVPLLVVRLYDRRDRRGR